MKTAIIYLSKHGTTEKVARKIQSLMPNEDVTLINMKSQKHPELTSFDRIIIGGSVYAGTVSKKLMKFCQIHEPVLSVKELGLFVCGMEPNPDKQLVELNSAFPESLRSCAKSSAFLGGEFLIDKMNFIEKLIIKKIAHVEKTTSNIKEEAIELFVKKF